MIAKSITSTQKYTQHPPRYTEASLVKKLEELGIGRPSTYAPTITTIMNRGYVVKGELDGQQRSCTIHILENGEISTKTTTEIIGKDKGKLRPENIGMLVTDYLSEHFPTILDYGFTAKVEEDFDEIAEGKAIWNSVIAEFYAPFHNKVEETLAEKEYTRNERELGTDPTTGKIVSVRMAKYGAVVQIGASDDPDKRYAGMKSGQLLETITLEEALKLFELPRTLGEYQGFEVIVAKGRFGPYVRLDKEFFSLAKGQDPMEITLDDAIKLIEDKRLKDSQKVIATFPDSDIEILNGRYGPYFKQGSQNYKLPKEIDAYNITEKECLDMIASGEAIATGGAKKRTTTKKK
jgi:DNA topoisomerase-1